MCSYVFLHIDALSSRFLRYSRPSQHSSAPFTVLRELLYSSGAPSWEDTPHVPSKLPNCAFTHT